MEWISCGRLLGQLVVWASFVLVFPFDLRSFARVMRSLKEDVFGKIPARGHAVICVAVHATRLACLSFMQVVRSRLPDAYAQIFAEALCRLLCAKDLSKMRTVCKRMAFVEVSRHGAAEEARVGDRPNTPSQNQLRSLCPLADKVRNRRPASVFRRVAAAGGSPRRQASERPARGENTNLDSHLR